jgi:tetratricopeptide (TPR) repeat protein
VASNPRIDDLRKRLDKDPASRLFAQLAEELRKDGDLEEAIRVCREGLLKHPAYPSARMTLGRALLDTGDIAAARTEFEIVLKGAPDNILASRFLGECLEGLGDLPAARDRFKATLGLAPGDKQVTARLQEVEAKLKKAPASSAATVIMGSPAVTPVPPPPIPLSRVDEPMELESSAQARTILMRPEAMPSAEPTVVMTPTVVMPAPAPPPPAAPPRPPAAAPPAAPAPSATAGAEPPPIPLVEADEDFELERPYEAPPVSPSPTTAASETRPPAVSTPPPPQAYEPPAQPTEFEFDLGPSGAAAPLPEPWQPEPMAEQFVTEPEREPEPEPEPEAEPPIPPPTIAAPPPPPPVPVRSPAPEPVVTAPPPLPPPVFAAAPPPPPRIEAPPPPKIEAPPPAPPPPPPPVEAVAARPPEADDLTSSTLAELYFNQGFTDKAIEVYRQLLQREPGNERGRTRLAELEALEHRLAEEEARAPSPAGGAGDAAAVRRQAIERTIARLEGLLSALRKESGS